MLVLALALALALALEQKFLVLRSHPSITATDSNDFYHCVFAFLHSRS